MPSKKFFVVATNKEAIGIKKITVIYAFNELIFKKGFQFAKQSVNFDLDLWKGGLSSLQDRKIGHP